MKKFTRLLCTLLMLCTVGVANAQDDMVDIVVNGDIEGTDLSFFAVHEFVNGAGTNFTENIRVVADPTNPSNHCIAVTTQENAGEDWNGQFFVTLPKSVEEFYPGDEFQLIMDVMGTEAGSRGTQSHAGPGDYNHWACCGNVSFTTTWSTWTSSVVKVDGSMSPTSKLMRSIAINLALKEQKSNTFYFDNIKLKVKRSKRPSNIKWINLVKNSSCETDDASCLIGKDADGGGAFETHFVDGKGSNNSRGIIVKSKEHKQTGFDNNNNPTWDGQGWDSQFFITTASGHKFKEGEFYKIRFNYRADAAATAGTQSHGAPGAYIHWAFIGNVDFTNSWKTFEQTGIITKDQAGANGAQTIALNLNDSHIATNFYFDNVFFYIDSDNATAEDLEAAKDIEAEGNGGGDEDDPNKDPARIEEAKVCLEQAILDAAEAAKPGASEYRAGVLDNTIKQGRLMLTMPVDNLTVSWINNMIARLKNVVDTQMDPDPKPSVPETKPATYKGVKADLKAAVDAAIATLQANLNKPEGPKTTLAALISQGQTILVNDYSSMDQEEFEEWVNTIIDRIKAAEEALKNAKEESSTPEPTPSDDNKIWLYNVGADKYVVGGNDWATRASLREGGIAMTYEVVGENKMILYTDPLYAGKNLGFDGTNGFIDMSNRTQWNVKPVEGKDGYYTISVEADSKYLAWDGESTKTIVSEAMPATAENAYWMLRTKADIEATFAGASKDNPIDATFYISNPDFSRDASLAAWDMKANNQNLSGGPWSGNRVAESYHSKFTLSQTFKVVDGKYMLKVQCFYRNDGENDAAKLPVVYANGAEIVFPERTGSENSMDAASAAFTNGLYEADPVIVDVVGGDLTIGVKGESTTIWAIWDNFRLYNIGDPDISAEKGAWLAMMNKLRNVISGGYDEGLGKEKVHRPGCKEILAISSYQIGREEFEQLVKNAEEKILDQVSTNITTIQATIDELIAARVAFVAANKPVVEPGKVYIRNVATGKWWGAGNDWGTRASLIDHPEYVTLDMPASYYTMETQVSNSLKDGKDNGTAYYFEGDYMDNANAKHLTIDQKGNYFLISADGQYYGYDGESTVLGKNVDSQSENALWEIFTEDQMKLQLANASVSNPVDATWLILDPNFGRNQRNKLTWTISANNKNLGGGDVVNYVAESYKSEFELSQVLSKAPKGVYQLTAQAYYRVEADGTDEILPVIYANEATSPFQLRTGTENSMTDASHSFSSGLYEVEPVYVEVAEDGALTVGAKLEGNSTLWSVWDNFALTYYGADASIDAVKNSSVFTDLAKLIKDGEALLDQVEVDKVKNALSKAIEAGKAAKSLDECNAAMADLKEAVASAEGSVKAKDVLPKMKELVDMNNIATAEALEEYYGQWVTKYQEGTITKAEASALQDPTVITGWHASITCDNYLLSAWDAEPDFQSPYYINTWSVEGDNDGTNFHVPFIEYWTGDDNSLGEKTMTAAIDGVPAGKYTVEAWVRVRMKNSGSAPTYGISMQANGSNPVDVCDGEESTDGSSTFFNKVYQIPVTIGADGALTVSFDIASDNNVSWLAIKNVRYFDPNATGIKTVGTQKAAGQIFNLQGQRVNKATKGVFIQDGKIILKK